MVYQSASWLPVLAGIKHTSPSARARPTQNAPGNTLRMEAATPNVSNVDRCPKLRKPCSMLAADGVARKKTVAGNVKAPAAQHQLQRLPADSLIAGTQAVALEVRLIARPGLWHAGLRGRSLFSKKQKWNRGTYCLPSPYFAHFPSKTLGSCTCFPQWLPHEKVVLVPMCTPKCQKNPIAGILANVH